MTDTRSRHRTRTYIGGTISYLGHRSTVECLVRNVSQAGAMIVLPPETLIPDAFDLELRPAGAKHRAHVVWRTADGAGLRFGETPLQGPIPLALARRVKALEAERDRLKGQVATLLARQPT